MLGRACIHLSYMHPLGSTQILHAFQGFMIHIIPQAPWSAMVADPWQYTLGYMSWFFRVSHPLLTPPT